MIGIQLAKLWQVVHRSLSCPQRIFVFLSTATATEKDVTTYLCMYICLYVAICHPCAHHVRVLCKCISMHAPQSPSATDKDRQLMLCVNSKYTCSSPKLLHARVMSYSMLVSGAQLRRRCLENTGKGRVGRRHV